jgi:hypothetical protein
MRAVAVGVFLFSVAACGEITPVPVDSGPPETFAHQFGRAVCDNLKDCCVAQNLAFDRSACIAVIAGQVQTDSVLAGYPDRPFHAEIGGQCLRSAAARAKTCDLTSIRTNWSSTPVLDWASCFGLYSASASFDAPCVHGNDCASGRCGVEHCQRIVPQPGDRCDGSWDCQSFDLGVPTSLHCDAISKTCNSPAEPDGACTWDGDCAGILAPNPASRCCSVQGGQTQGTCVSPAAIGSSCNCNYTACEGVCDENDKCIAAPVRGATCTKYGRCGAGDLCDDTHHCASHLSLFCGVP